MAIKISGNTVISDSQAITSTSTISATGTVTAGNVATAGTISSTGNITGGNIVTSGTISATTIVANITPPAGGTVSTTGNITGGNILTSGIVSATGNITGGNISATNHTGTAVSVTGAVTGASLVGAVTTASQTNITSVGTLGSLSVTGTITGGNLATGGTVSAVGNATVGNLSATNITGTLASASQTNITSVGTLGSLSVTGNVQAGNIRTAGLISATGSITVGGDISLTGNIVDAAAMTVSTSSNGNITLSPNGSGVVVVTTDIRNGQANGTGNIGASGAAFNTIFAKATSAQYADLAEKYEADAEYAPGTVLEFGGNKEVTLSAEASSTRVAGVVSTNPSYIMNAGLTAEHVALVALQGRVPCQVIGPVAKGDMMVSAGNGAARVDNSARAGSIIGKSLENFDGASGTIEVVIGRN